MAANLRRTVAGAPARLAFAMALASAAEIAPAASAQGDPIEIAIANQRALLSRQAQAPRPRDLALAPDGRRLFYVAETGQPGGVTTPARAGFILDLGTRRRIAIDLPPGRDSEEPQWRPNGNELAFLSVGERRLTLIRHDASGVRPPARTDLSAFAQGVLAERQLCGWLWLPERDQLVVATLATARAPEAAAPDPWWIRWSAPREAPRGAGATRQLGLHAIDLATGQWRDFRFEGELRTPLTCIGGLTAKLSREPSGAAQLIFGVDRRVGRHGSRVDIAHRIYRLDLDAATGTQVGSATDLYNGIVTTAGGGRYAVFDDGTLERDQNYARNHFYRIGAIRPGVDPRPIAVPALSLPRLFPGPRPDSLIAFEDTRPNGRLIEIDPASGRRTDIGPAQFSVSDADVSADGRTIAAVLETMTDAPALYVRQSGGRGWRHVETGAAPVPAPSQVRIVRWPSRDGRFEIGGLLVLPPSYREGQSYPLIVAMHGGPASGAVRNRYGPVGEPVMGGLSPFFFADAGYLVFLPNFRGDVGASLEFYQASYGRPGDSFDLDIEAGVDQLIRRGMADERRMVLFAHSAGGLVLGHALNRPSRYRAAVANDSLIMPDLFERLLRVRGASSDVEGRSAYFGIDMLRERWLDPHNMSVPLLMRWEASPGCGDRGLAAPPCIPFERQSEELAPVLAERGIPFDVIVDRDRHVIQNPDYAIEYQRMILAWYERFLPAVP